jgi:hypothetical protein
MLQSFYTKQTQNKTAPQGRLLIIYLNVKTMCSQTAELRGINRRCSWPNRHPLLLQRPILRLRVHGAHVRFFQLDQSILS